MGKKLKDIPNDMIFADNFIEVKVGKRTQGYYRVLGYEAEDSKNILVRIQNLSHGSQQIVTIICPRCKKKRNIKYSKAIHRGHTYCSPCSTFLTQFIDLSKRRFGRWLVLSFRGNENKRKYWNCVCDRGQYKVISGGALVSGNSKSCGCYDRECAKERWSGPNHYLWRNDISEDERKRNRRFNRTEKEKIWSRSILERDNFMCNVCNKVGGILHAHHLYGWANYPNLRFNVDNGITLCKDCHNKFHKNYGNRNNVPDQFYEWMNNGTTKLHS